MSKQDEKETATTQQNTDSPVLIDEYLETLKRIDDHVSLYDQMSEEDKTWLLYNFKRKNFDAITSNKFKRLVISYQMESRYFHEAYRAYSIARANYRKISSNASYSQQLQEKAVATLKSEIEFMSQQRMQRAENLRLYQILIDEMLVTNKSVIKMASKLKDPAQSKHVSDRSKMLKLAAKIRKEIAVYRVVCQLREDSLLRFEDNEKLFVFSDDPVYVVIGRISWMTIGDGKYYSLGNLEYFDFDDFYKTLPKRYWLGVQRQKRIDSILED